MKGERGPPGNTGLRGPPGYGYKGSRGPPGPPGGGVTYTYWGKTSCPSGRTTVYKGYAGGSHWNTFGGGSNLLCATDLPKYNSGWTPVDRGSAKLYGAELKTSRQILGGVVNGNVPCAVCHVSTRSSQIMVPGTYECPSGWIREYDGWLMAPNLGHRNHNSFTCMAKWPDTVPGFSGEQFGNFLYHVEADCASGIECPPYNSQREMSCVVCTK